MTVLNRRQPADGIRLLHRRHINPKSGIRVMTPAAPVVAAPAPIVVRAGRDSIKSIPLAKSGEYEVNDKEAAAMRSDVYWLNKHAAPMKFRTMREGGKLLIWRIK